MHSTHLGVNRAATLINDDDLAAYLKALELTAGEQRAAIHGYVLMTNHVHLLVSALEVGAVARMMQGLGRRYVRASMQSPIEPVRSGKDATSRVWWTLIATC